MLLKKKRKGGGRGKGGGKGERGGKGGDRNIYIFYLSLSIYLYLSISLSIDKMKEKRERVEGEMEEKNKILFFSPRLSNFHQPWTKILQIMRRIHSKRKTSSKLLI